MALELLQSLLDLVAETRLGSRTWQQYPPSPPPPRPRPRRRPPKLELKTTSLPGLMCRLCLCAWNSEGCARRMVAGLCHRGRLSRCLCPSTVDPLGTSRACAPRMSSQRQGSRCRSLRLGRAGTSRKGTLHRHLHRRSRRPPHGCSPSDCAPQVIWGRVPSTGRLWRGYLQLGQRKGRSGASAQRSGGEAAGRISGRISGRAHQQARRGAGGRISAEAAGA